MAFWASWLRYCCRASPAWRADSASWRSFSPMLCAACWKDWERLWRSPGVTRGLALAQGVAQVPQGLLPLGQVGVLLVLGVLLGLLAGVLGLALLLPRLLPRLPRVLLLPRLPWRVLLSHPAPGLVADLIGAFRAPLDPLQV